MERMKILVVGCIFLFSIITPSTQGVNTIEGNIIIVDNEGDGDYTSIKDALNNANPGDTIEVYSGTYYEHGIDVEKEGITFQGISHELGNGSDTGKPSIDGEGVSDVFIFRVKNVTLDNFHIENAGQPHLESILIIVADSCTISNNDLLHSTSSIIYIEDSNNNKILNNVIAHSVVYPGVCIYGTSKYTLISGNNISYCKDGILMWGSGSTHHTITGNRIANCSRFGVDFALGEHSVFEGNHIEGNDVGIQIVGPDISVKNNNFLNNRLNILYVSSIDWIIKMFRSVSFNGNFYDNYIGLGPKLIWGSLWFFPVAMPLNIDWHPAKEPYEI